MSTETTRQAADQLFSWTTTPGFLVIAVASLFMFVSSLYVYREVHETRRDLNSQISQLRWRKEDELRRRALLSRRLEQAEASNAETQGELAVLAKRLQMTGAEVQTARQQAQEVRGDFSQKLTTLATSVQSELATKASAEDLSNADTKVGGVRTDLDAIREDLKMAGGEMGTLIARNHDEIDQLRRIGERDYFEFALDLKEGRRKVGTVAIRLRGTDLKRNRFTVDLYVDDKQFMRKDYSVGEPIYFYTSGVRSPLELVVSRMARNRISGYLSVPKSLQAPSR